MGLLSFLRPKPRYSKEVAEKLFYPGIYALVARHERMDLLDEAWAAARRHIHPMRDFTNLDERAAVRAAEQVLGV